MKLVDKYYDKLYKETAKITKKLFGTNVTDSLMLRYKLKKEIETVIEKPINKITDNDIIKYKLGYDYAKYRTISNILEVVERACVLRTFTIEELEDER